MRKTEQKSSFRSVIYMHISNNLKEYFIVAIFLLIGIVLGVIFINNTSEQQQVEISQYINTFVATIKEGKQVNTNELLKDSIIGNVIQALILWFVGSTVIGMPIVCGIIAFRGFSLSYTISSIIATLGTSKGIIFCIFSILLQNILFIPCILALGVSGIKLYKSIMKDKRKENIRLEIYRHTIFSLFMAFFLIVSSFIEAYISSYLLQFYIKYI